MGLSEDQLTYLNIKDVSQLKLKKAKSDTSAVPKQVIKFQSIKVEKHEEKLQKKKDTKVAKKKVNNNDILLDQLNEIIKSSPSSNESSSDSLLDGLNIKIDLSKIM